MGHSTIIICHSREKGARAIERGRAMAPDWSVEKWPNYLVIVISLTARFPALQLLTLQLLTLQLLTLCFLTASFPALWLLVFPLSDCFTVTKNLFSCGHGSHDSEKETTASSLYRSNKCLIGLGIQILKGHLVLHQIPYLITVISKQYEV